MRIAGFLITSAGFFALTHYTNWQTSLAITVVSIDSISDASKNVSRCKELGRAHPK